VTIEPKREREEDEDTLPERDDQNFDPRTT
jgi:hypothetical protein